MHFIKKILPPIISRLNDQCAKLFGHNFNEEKKVLERYSTVIRINVRKSQLRKGYTSQKGKNQKTSFVLHQYISQKKFWMVT